MMNRNEMKTMMRACKLKVLPNGIVRGGDLSYCVLTGKEVRFLTGTADPVSLDDVESIGMINGRTLEIRTSDGSSVTVEGTTLTPLEVATITTQSLKMPRNIRQVRDALDLVCPDVDNLLLRDELKEKDFVHASLIGAEGDRMVELTDDVLKKFHEHYIDLLYENGYFSQSDAVPSNAVMDEVLANKLYDNTSNTFREWLLTLKWDGVSRMRGWFADTVGATAPPLRALGPGCESKYVEDVSALWFVGAVARNLESSAVTQDIVPVLISSQGLGKGAFLRYTSYIPRDWYRGTAESVKDAKRFLEGIRGGVIVELEEAVQLEKDDPSSIKAFISKSSDQLRKPYAAREQACPRHFVFVISSNKNTLFTDDTGNRRFFPMYLDESRQTRTISVNPDNTEAHYDVEQVWAEAVEMYRRGHPYTLNGDNELARLSQIMQRYCQNDDVDIDRIDDYLNDPVNGYTDIGSKVNYRVIVEDIFGVSYARNKIPQEIKDSVNKWSAKSAEWVKLPQSIRVGDRVSKGWQRIHDQTTAQPVRRLKIDTGRKEINGFEYGATEDE